MIFNPCIIISKPKKIQIPKFTYSGEYLIIDDSEKTGIEGSYRIKFLTSGTMIIEQSPKEYYVDVFCVGGGGSGRNASSNVPCGGGGYTNTVYNLWIGTKDGITLRNTIAVDIGNGGISAPTTASTRDGSQSAFRSSGFTGTEYDFTVSANGGKAGENNASGKGGDGGSGGGSSSGKGGIDGSNGKTSTTGSYTQTGGLGQGFTTREFGEPDGDLYAGGGSGQTITTSPGGGGGGYGPASSSTKHGLPHTGGGGGAQGNGGSGIVIIRNARFN